MSRDMLGIAVRKLVTLPIQTLGIVCDLLEKLTDQEWVEAAKRFLRKENPWPQVLKSLLKLVTYVEVSGSNKFVAADNFKIGNAGVTYLGEDFKTNFLGKVEENVTDATLVIHQLEKASPDKDILSELGNNRKETFLAYLFELLKKQSEGETGRLLTNGHVNIFYIRDAKGNLWAVNARWGSINRGWSVCAISVGGPDRWGSGGQVLSCK